MFVVVFIVFIGFVDLLVVIVIIFDFINENIIIVILSRIEFILFGINLFCLIKFEVLGVFVFGINFKIIVRFR